MAREIKLDQPLSEGDRKYLADRDRWYDIARADGHDDPRRAKREHQSGAAAPTQPALPPTDPQVSARDRQEAQASKTPDTEEVLPYEEWSFDDLKAELDDRKAEALEGGMSSEDAAKRYSKGGSQKDLVARLKADDEDRTEDQQ